MVLTLHPRINQNVTCIQTLVNVFSNSKNIVHQAQGLKIYKTQNYILGSFMKIRNQKLTKDPTKLSAAEKFSVA